MNELTHLNPVPPHPLCSISEETLSSELIGRQVGKARVRCDEDVAFVVVIRIVSCDEDDVDMSHRKRVVTS